MFGLSWEQIFIILLVGVFLLGPERIPIAVQWVITTLRKVRTLAAGAQAQLRTEIGPELDELRRQIAELQSLKEIQELRELRDLHPRRIIGRNILGDEFSGGISGFMKASTAAPTTPAAAGPAAATAPGVPAPAVTGEPSPAQVSSDLAALTDPPAGQAPGTVADGRGVEIPFDPDAT